MTLSVGSTIWTRDSRNSRKGWEKHVITGETRQSWLVKTHEWAPPRKILKMTMLENHGRWGHERWYSEEQKADREFIDRHRRRISQWVEAESDVSKLKAIADILGYPTE